MFLVVMTVRYVLQGFIVISCVFIELNIFDSLINWCLNFNVIFVKMGISCFIFLLLE